MTSLPLCPILTRADFKIKINNTTHLRAWKQAGKTKKNLSTQLNKKDKTGFSKMSLNIVVTSK